MSYFPMQPPLGYSREEREDITYQIACELCGANAYYVTEVLQAYAADGYLRVVYNLSGDDEEYIVAERVNASKIQHLSLPLQRLLHRQKLGPDTSVPCWLTVRLAEDGCVLQHCLFTISTESSDPQQFSVYIELEDSRNCTIQLDSASTTPAASSCARGAEGHEWSAIQPTSSSTAQSPQPPEEFLSLPPLSSKNTAFEQHSAGRYDQRKNYQNDSGSIRQPSLEMRSPGPRLGSTTPAARLPTPSKDSQRPDSARRRSSAYRDELWKRADSIMSHGELRYDDPPPQAITFH